MCHWVRESDRRRDIAGDAIPAKPAALRPRVVGAVAVALVALTAAAALPLATTTPAIPADHREPATIATVAARSVAPTGPVIEQTTAALDDGVPSTQRAPDTVSAGHHCDHGL